MLFASIDLIRAVRKTGMRKSLTDGGNVMFDWNRPSHEPAPRKRKKVPAGGFVLCSCGGLIRGIDFGQHATGGKHARRMVAKISAIRPVPPRRKPVAVSAVAM